MAFSERIVSLANACNEAQKGTKQEEAYHVLRDALLEERGEWSLDSLRDLRGRVSSETKFRIEEILFGEAWNKVTPEEREAVHEDEIDMDPSSDNAAWRLLDSLFDRIGIRGAAADVRTVLEDPVQLVDWIYRFSLTAGLSEAEEAE